MQIDPRLAVLTALASCPDARESIDQCHEGFWKEPKQKALFRCVVSLHQEGSAIDAVTVNQKARRLGEHLDPLFIGEATTAPDCQGFTSWLEIVRAEYLREQLMIASSEIQVEAFDESQEASAVMGKAVGMLEVLATQFSVTKEVALGDEVANILEESEDIALGEATPGDSTGFGGLDDAFGGLRGGDLVIVAGRPGMGKTALAGDIIQAFLDRGEPAGFISLEMSRKELIGRQIAKKSEIDSLGLSTGSLTESDWIRSTKGAAVLMRQPLFIEDDPTINVSAAKGVIRKWVRLHGIKVVVVDYIQLMGGTGSEGNREQEIAGISRGLKVAAKELNIPVIALSQLNRGLELRGGRKRPTMADLRESGAIEQDADIVLMCYRPDYYGFTEWEDGEACQGQAEVIIAKSRRGGTKDVRLEWVDYCAKFKDRN